MSKEITKAANFIKHIIEEDLKAGRYNTVITRFPPEPNGYLHIGHAKSICLNFGMAQDFHGLCNLRFDDTNPNNENIEYITAIQHDIEWLGFQWSNEVKFASDYFDTLYEYAQKLIKQGDAYVCDLSAEEAKLYRGSLHEPGKNSPYRDRSIQENLELFARMKNGEFAEGAKTLRAKIDMASSNINMRDPTLYRIKYAFHHQTKDKWCIYPSYDFTHGQSDALENITHSLCTLEFEDHRPLYEWLLEKIDAPSRPKQYEFARLNLNYTVTSKRKLKSLVENNIVNGWDDPRLSTLQGMRRRGIPPEAIRNFCDIIGINKAGGTVDLNVFDSVVREHLDIHSMRRMCVISPLKVVITNLNTTEILETNNHPKQDLGKRQIYFTPEIFIDKNDFAEVPPKGFKRLVIGEEVRLRGAYVIKANEIIKNTQGDIIEIRATIDKNTLGTNPLDRKVKGVIHWVSSTHSIDCEVRLYDRLFISANPEDGENSFLDNINPNSLIVMHGCKAEASLTSALHEDRFQFEREGYFSLDRDSCATKIVFNRIVALKDSW